MFKKAKPTFLSRAGRQGAPSVLQPRGTNTKRSAIKGAAAMSKATPAKTASARNGRVFGSSKAKGAVNNYRTGRKAGKFSLGRKMSIDKRLSNYFMSHSPKLTSVTNSPQSAPQSFKPRG